jgi:hypothetical protein
VISIFSEISNCVSHMYNLLSSKEIVYILIISSMRKEMLVRCASVDAAYWINTTTSWRALPECI